jgi:hypothetical protein
LSDDTWTAERADQRDASDASRVTCASRCDEHQTCEQHAETIVAYLSGIGIGSFGRALAAALLLGTAVLTFTPGDVAFAARSVSTEVEAGDSDNGGGGSGGVIYRGTTPRKTLEAMGYTCRPTGVAGPIECTKPGHTTYWCDKSGSCATKPRNAVWDQGIVAPQGSGTATTQP